MGNGRRAAALARSGWLLAVVIALVLLVGVPAAAWHEEHADDHECAVCHSGRQTADLARPLESAPSQAHVRLEHARETCRAPVRRVLRRPARAPPA